MKEELTVHMLIKDEIESAAYAVASTVPYAAKALITDTGSTDGTWEVLQDLTERFPNIELEQDLNVPDSKGYRFDEQGQLHVDFPPHGELLRVRNSHIERTTTKWSWVVDGDEVWPFASVQAMHKKLEETKDQFRIGYYVPFLHFAVDHLHVAKGTSPLYGRIFKTEGCNVRHEAPYEQHYWHDIWVGPNTPGVEVINDAPVHHYQMLFKPWRRAIQDLKPYVGQQAEVWGVSYLRALTDKHRREITAPVNA